MRLFDYARQQLKEINEEIKELNKYYGEKRKDGTYTSFDRQEYYCQRSRLYEEYDYYDRLLESCEE